MNNVELLATYLRRRYRGRVEEDLSNRLVLVYKRRKIEFRLLNGEIFIHFRLSSDSKSRIVKFHMANPKFKEEFDKFLQSDLRIQTSKLKADF
jgi:hypothetical protein